MQRNEKDRFVKGLCSSKYTMKYRSTISLMNQRFLDESEIEWKFKINVEFPLKSHDGFTESTVILVTGKRKTAIV